MCRRTDPRYVEIRDRHYIPNHGCIGQQIHYLVFLDDEVVGIISGASAVYAVKSRDDYFGLTKENKRPGLNSIINNAVFRLERNIKNLGSQILALWRRTIAKDWEEKYGVKVHGFETFIIGNEVRFGALYKADNWDFVGNTAGSTKFHRGLDKKAERTSTCTKMVFCKKVPKTKLCTSYIPTWNRKSGKNLEKPTEGGTADAGIDDNTQA